MVTANTHKDGTGLNRLRETFEVTAAVSRTMKSNSSKNTKPELNLRRSLWRKGVRGYRINVEYIVGVFVHGCFWHACENCGNFRFPKKNADFWRLKILGNVERDKKVQETLSGLGYRTLVIWECELATNIESCVERIIAELKVACPTNSSQPSINPLL